MLVFCYDLPFGVDYFCGLPDNPETWDWTTQDIDCATRFNDFSDYWELLCYLKNNGYVPFWG